MRWEYVVLTAVLMPLITCRPNAKLLTIPDNTPVQVESRRAESIVSTTLNTAEQSDASKVASIQDDVAANNQSLPSNGRVLDNKEAKRHEVPLLNKVRATGVAVPMTYEDMEREMAVADAKHKESSTPKDGISTWILLSGSQPTVQPEMAENTNAKLNPNQKVDKIAKVKDTTPTTKPPRQNDKAKTKPMNDESTESATTPTVKPANRLRVPPSLRAGAADNKKPAVKKPQTTVAPPKKKAPTTPATTTTTEPEMETEVTTLSPKPETTTFLIMEPKDADFDLPQDRSPGITTKKKPKRPATNATNNKTKRKKNPIKKPADDKLDTEVAPLKNKNVLKNPNKQDKPMTTKIYNYLSREVMPTVGVGLVGLVLTAGIASYFFGPLGALRRSYDISDRKDDMYFHNSEEYAGNDAGQSEEEIFGKVIAGMPSSSLYKNNIRPSGSNPQHRPNHYQSNYKSPSPHYNNRYRPNYSNHSPYYNQYNQQQQQAVPAYRHNSQAQQPNFMHMAMNDIQSTLGITNPNTTPTKPTSAEVIVGDTIHTSTHLEDVNSNAEADQKASDNVLEKRTQFVVGSVLPEANSAEDTPVAAIASAVPEHGPRRRKRSVTKKDLPTVKGTDNSATNKKNCDEELKMVASKMNALKLSIKKVAESPKAQTFNKELKRLEYEERHLTRMNEEIKDVQLYQDRLSVDLLTSVRKGIKRLHFDMQFLTNTLKNEQETIENVTKLAVDGEATTELGSKMLDSEETTLKDEVTTVSDNENKITELFKNGESITEESVTDSFDNIEELHYPRPGVGGFLKFLEFKAQFALNVLREIRPALQRAADDVFRTIRGGNAPQGQHE